MTPNELYQLTEVLINGGRERSYYSSMVPSALNILLEEVRDCNNLLRKRAGKELVPYFPIITHLEQEIDLEETTARSILPYGLASMLLYEDNPTKATIYRNLFSYKLSYPSYCTIEQVKDCYGGGGYGV